MLEQSSTIKKRGLEGFEAAEFAPYQRSLREISEASGVEFDEILHHADVLTGVSGGEPREKRRIRKPRDIRKRPDNLRALKLQHHTIASRKLHQVPAQRMCGAAQQGFHEGPELCLVQRADHGFHGANARWHHAHRCHADADKPHGFKRTAAKFTAQRHLLAVLLALFDNHAHGAQGRRAQWIIAARQFRIAAIRGKQELHQIIGANRGKIHQRQQLVELPDQ